MHEVSFKNRCKAQLVKKDMPDPNLSAKTTTIEVNFAHIIKLVYSRPLLISNSLKAIDIKEAA